MSNFKVNQANLIKLRSKVRKYRKKQRKELWGLWQAEAKLQRKLAKMKKESTKRAFLKHQLNRANIKGNPTKKRVLECALSLAEEHSLINEAAKAFAVKYKQEHNT